MGDWTREIYGSDERRHCRHADVMDTRRRRRSRCGCGCWHDM